MHSNIVQSAQLHTSLFIYTALKYTQTKVRSAQLHTSLFIYIAVKYTHTQYSQHNYTPDCSSTLLLNTHKHSTVSTTTHFVVHLHSWQIHTNTVQSAQLHTSLFIYTAGKYTQTQYSQNNYKPYSSPRQLSNTHKLSTVSKTTHLAFQLNSC